MPARTPAGFLWRAVLVDRWGGQGKAKRAGLSFSSATSFTYSHRSSNSSDDYEPAPENSAAHMLPPGRATPSAAPPALAAPPPLPADLARITRRFRSGDTLPGLIGRVEKAAERAARRMHRRAVARPARRAARRAVSLRGPRLFELRAQAGAAAEARRVAGGASLRRRRGVR
eukprot:scaffold68819_cov49-Phaeocystis_antarctica.AAC.1